MTVNPVIAFDGPRKIAFGPLSEVARKTKQLIDRQKPSNLLIFDAVTSRPVEIDFRGTTHDVLRRLAPPANQPESERKGPGRPRLGVVPREVTLLPRHWDWLNSQPGGASVALRKLVEEARKTSAPQDELREAQEAAYRFMSAVAGNLPGYEEALRAFYARKPATFHSIISKWPKDVQEHVHRLSRRPLKAPAKSPLKETAHK